MQTTYLKGDLVEYTGKEIDLFGAKFYEVKVLEGVNAGKLLLVKNPPTPEVRA